MYPVLFVIPGLDAAVPSYVVFGLIGLALGWLACRRHARSRGVPLDRLASGYAAAALAGVFGGRLGWLFADPNRFDSWTELFALGDGQTSLAAGLVSAAFVASLHAHRHHIEPRRWLDAAAAGLLVALACERVGTMLAGTEFGAPASGLAWAVRYPIDSAAYLHHQEVFRGLEKLGDASLPVHPTAFYVAIPAAVIGASLAQWPVSRRPGTASAVALAFIGLIAFGLADAFAGRPSAIIAGPVRSAHVAAAACLAASWWLSRPRVAAGRELANMAPPRRTRRRGQSRKKRR